MPRRRYQAKTSAETIRLAEKKCQAFRLRKAGLSLAEIGQRIGTSPTTVQRWITKGLAEALQGSREELAAMHYARLEDVVQASHAEMLKGENAIACANYRWAVTEQNKMIGVAQGQTTLTLKTGGAEQKGIQVSFVGSRFANEPALPPDSWTVENFDQTRLKQINPPTAPEPEPYWDNAEPEPVATQSQPASPDPLQHLVGTDRYKRERYRLPHERSGQTFPQQPLPEEVEPQPNGFSERVINGQHGKRR